MDDLIVLKIGGSVITDKSRPFHIRYDVVRRIAREIRDYLEEFPMNKLIIVHGGGSFGHFIVHEYFKYEQGLDQEALVEIHCAMLELSLALASEFRLHGLQVSVLPTHAYTSMSCGRILMELRPMMALLDSRVIPISYGDAVVDVCTHSIEILSGDTLAWELAYRLRARKLLFATSVDGIFSAPPGLPNAKLISELRLSELSRLRDSMGRVQGFDVTGGMYRKLVEGIGRIREDMEVFVFNGLRAGEIYRALKDRPGIGTVIRP